MGIPLPGETILVVSLILAGTSGHISPWGIFAGAAIGAIVGDSIGYAIGRRGGRPLLERIGRRFPKHAGPKQLAQAEHMFAKWGPWAVFIGRFIAVLRIFAGPIAGALNMKYRKFLVANATGGIFWAGSITLLVTWLHEAATKYLKGFAWIGLLVAVLGAIGTTLYLRHRASKIQLPDHPEITESTPEAASTRPND
ncbi:DedA family protein [Pseudonocardiaceae bacterium YIM PH 21723]|nr:DedA family protein [Pseudonocardiaceae bacterium YIM PH 21723]